jgi:hypothetical protein
MKPQAIILFGFRVPLITLLAVAVLALTTLPSSQAADENVLWYQVLSVRFKVGKADEALKIIHEHFFKVDKTIGRKVLPFDYKTGEWDHVVYFPFDTARMDTIPPVAEWMKAFEKQEGGVEQAHKLFQSFWEMVAVSKTEIAQRPQMWLP